MQDMENRLKIKNIRQEDFRAVCSILLTKGLLARSDGGDSARLYDVAARCEDELREYLAFAFPVILMNTLRPPHFRLIPSHHRDVGLIDADEDLEMRREIKQSVVQSLAAALLALRMLYDEQLLERRVDAAGRISVKLTELALFMNTTFGIGLPQTKTDQRALFMKLKKHGAIDVRIEALSDEDAVIVIRHEILTLVWEPNVRGAQAAFETDRADQPTAAEPHAALETSGTKIIAFDGPDQDTTGFS